MDLDKKAVTFVITNAQPPDTEVARVFRVDWKDGHQFEEWWQEPGVRNYYVYPFESDRLRKANITLHTTNELGETSLHYFLMPGLSRLDWWLALIDAKFPVTTEAGVKPGRPIKRVLEALTTRQRRLAYNPKRTY